MADTDKTCRRAMANAADYTEWREAADRHDAISGAADWREQQDSPHYDAAELKRSIVLMERHWRERDVEPLIDLLQESLHRHLNDVLEPELYTTALGGTKHLVRRWLEAVERVIDGLVDLDSPDWPTHRKLEVVSRAYKNLGRSGLLLSGGATLGFYHMGVVRALWRAGLLPEVIVGASMGAMVAAGVCARDADELKTLFATDQPDIETVGLEWRPLLEALRTRTLMRPERMLATIEKNCGTYSFAEAFARSGRVLGISLMPTRRRQKPRILNHLTAPDLYIPRAALASAAVPGLFPPVALTRLDRQGEETPYIEGETWIDGSFGGDLPRERVSRLHNVNHFIFSQTQPHMLPFVAGANQKGLVRLASKAALSAARTQGLQALSVGRKLTAKTPFGAGLNLAHAVVQQDFSGDIDIHPRFDPRVYAKLLKNPSRADLGFFIQEGERATWPKLAHIRDSTRIARCLARNEARLLQS